MSPHFLETLPMNRPRLTLRSAAVAGLLLAALVAPGAAMAQSKGKKGARTVSFEDDVIEATYIRPEGGTIDVKQNQRQSLIRIRTNFFAELFRSAEGL